MKVILTRDVPQVGHDGDIVLVADGYARNYLFPRQLAVLAKGGALKSHQHRLSRSEAVGADALAVATAQATKIDGQTFQVIVKTAINSTRLYGAVTEADAAEAIKKALGIEVDKRKINLIDPIKVTGTYELTAKLHPKAAATFNLEVATQEQLDHKVALALAAAEAAAKTEAAAKAKADAVAAAAALAAAPEA